MKEILTLAVIRKQRQYPFRIFCSTLSAAFGVLITAAPMLYNRALDANTLLGLAVCFVCFGIPFGIFWGARRLISTLREKKAILHGEFTVLVDTVVSTRIMNHSVGSERGTRDSLIEFEKYSEVTGKCYPVHRATVNTTKEGDTFYLICLGEIENLITIFPEKQYALDDELRAYLRG